MRVLLVEDDAELAASVELMLRSESFICETTDLGEDGLQMAKLYDYDIVILDLMLPDIDGYEVLRRLRSARVSTPVLVLSGLGDLSLTCNGLQSRNMSLGVALGEQRRLADILGERRSVAEGVHSASAVVALARRLGVEMPISAAVDAIVNGGADIDTTIAALLERPFTVELTALP